MQCVKEFIFFNMLGIMVVLKLFSCFFFFFHIFVLLFVCVCAFPFLYTHSMEGQWKFDRGERS